MDEQKEMVIKLAQWPVLQLLAATCGETEPFNNLRIGDRGTYLTLKLDKNFVNEDTPHGVACMLEIVEKTWKPNIGVPTDDHAKSVVEYFTLLKSSALVFWKSFAEQNPKYSQYELKDDVNTLYFKEEVPQRIGVVPFYIGEDGQPWKPPSNVLERMKQRLEEHGEPVLDGVKEIEAPKDAEVPDESFEDAEEAPKVTEAPKDVEEVTEAPKAKATEDAKVATEDAPKAAEVATEDAEVPEDAPKDAEVPEDAPKDAEVPEAVESEVKESEDVSEAATETTEEAVETPKEEVKKAVETPVGDERGSRRGNAVRTPGTPVRPPRQKR